MGGFSALEMLPVVLFAFAVSSPLVPRRVQEVELPISELYNRYYHIFSLQTLDGTYEGEKTVLGQKISATMKIESSSTMKFTVSGPISISCDGEKFALSETGTTITFPGLTDPDDCLKKALDNNNIDISSVTYDSASNTVTAKVKFGISVITLVLDHVAAPSLTHQHQYVIPLAQLFDRYFDIFSAQGPNGVYKATKSVLGVQVVAVISIDSPTVFNFTITGPVSIDCANEAYTYNADGTLTLPNLDKAGDCLHDALAAQSVSLESFKYDATANEIDVSVKYTFLTITLDLAHQ
eukprot:c8276_g1_i1.p1 GENE.c8276_g1_i1~~c8276_g1_i1.p1  ORF type:complete len:294 (+),score=61.08 c8276_g1_i1:1-882(+)